jgi:hypothetical protein
MCSIDLRRKDVRPCECAYDQNVTRAGCNASLCVGSTKVRSRPFPADLQRQATHDAGTAQGASMVRRGSTVRARQRASRSRCKLRGFELSPLLGLATKVAPLRSPPRLRVTPSLFEEGIRDGASAGASLDVAAIWKEQLGVVPKHVGSSGPPWRLSADEGSSVPRRQPDEASR